ncbi:MAG: hypothetical protein IT577_13870 [Verrucomicrobiae bacterium]|nr:hypothetical protein [Verrucomicrobiae bacterium]
MNRTLPLIFNLGLAATGCGPVAGPAPGSHDPLLGWYRLPDYSRYQRVLPGPGTLIPVFKREGTYFSICRGVEVPLKGSPDGLEWAMLPSSMEGTRVGLDEASGRPYLVIHDSLRQYEADWSTAGEQQFMERIDRPPWLLDPTAKPPRSLEDFLGSFVPAWFPYFRGTVCRDGDGYGLRGEYVKDGGWEFHPEEAAALRPLPDELGFAWPKGKIALVFNLALRRYECVMGDEASGRVRMPLVRTAVSDRELPPGVPPPMRMGIPSWH